MPTLPPNPYIAQDIPRKAYAAMNLGLIKMFAMTTNSDPGLTDSYMLLALQHGAALTGDLMTAFYAAVWEAAHFMNAAAGSDAEDAEYELGKATCDHESCRVVNEAEATLIEAAIRGDGDAVQGICKAVVQEARGWKGRPEDEKPDPELALFMLWSGSLRRFFHALSPEIEG